MLKISIVNVILFTCIVSVANATTVEWEGVIDDSWADARNWSSGSLPTEDDLAILRQGSSVSVGSEGNIARGVALDVGAVIEVTESGLLTLRSPSLDSILSGSTINRGIFRSEGGFLVNEGRFENIGLLEVATFQTADNSGVFTNEGVVVADFLESFSGTNINSGRIETRDMQLRQILNLGELSGRSLTVGVMNNAGSVIAENLQILEQFENRGSLEVSSMDGGPGDGRIINHSEVRAGYVQSISSIENHSSFQSNGMERVHQIFNYGELNIDYGLADFVTNVGHATIENAANWGILTNRGTLESNGMAFFSSLDNNGGEIVNRGDMYVSAQELEGDFINEGLLDVVALEVFDFNGAFYGGGRISSFPDTVITFNELLSIGSSDLVGDLFRMSEGNITSFDLAGDSTGSINARQIELGGTLRLNISSPENLAEGLVFELFSAEQIGGSFENVQFNLSNSGYRLLTERYYESGLWHLRVRTTLDLSEPINQFWIVLAGFVLAWGLESLRKSGDGLSNLWGRRKAQERPAPR